AHATAGRFLPRATTHTGSAIASICQASVTPRNTLSGNVGGGTIDSATHIATSAVFPRPRHSGAINASIQIVLTTTYCGPNGLRNAARLTSASQDAARSRGSRSRFAATTARATTTAV